VTFLIQIEKRDVEVRSNYLPKKSIKTTAEILRFLCFLTRYLKEKVDVEERKLCCSLFKNLKFFETPLMKIF